MPASEREETVAELPGLNLAAVGEYLDRTNPGLRVGPLRAQLIAGGKSNLTYALSDDLHRWVLRRPPLGHVLATAHDMSREYRVISALDGTAVPVPGTHALCSTDDIIGAPFYVMDLVEGATYRWREELAVLEPDRVERISRNLVGVLANLHNVDPSDVGLGDFGRPEGYLERQVRRWGKQLDASRSRDLLGAEKLLEALRRGVPAASDATIVHGDFRLDNTLIGNSDSVVAVLDWEMATLGDPMADVALMIAYDALARHKDGDGIADASTAPGFISADQILAIYSVESGRDVSDMGFHLGLAFFKLAVILEGIHFRFINGQTVGEGFDRAGLLVEPALAAGLASIKE